MIIKTNFHNKGFALGLVLKQRLVASRKRPISFLKILTVKLRKPDEHLKYFGKCLLCYDQSHWRSGQANKPLNHKLITIVAYSLVISSPRHNSIPEIFSVFAVV